MRGITFDGKHSYTDLGLTIAYRDIGNPSKVKNKERVPFSNVDYDFSGIYGGQEYTERQITYGFNIVGYRGNKEHFVSMKIAVLNWLMRPNSKIDLFDDTIIGYRFLAEVEDSIELVENEADGMLGVTFTAYPFKIGELEEGNDIWDTFNFLLDYAQSTEHVISGSKEVILYNPGITLVGPVIKSSTQLEIKKGNRTFIIPSGETDSRDFMLASGENKLTITGNGTISFHFYKEVI